MGCHSLLQGIFPTQGSNPGLLHCRQTLYPLSHQGSPGINVTNIKILHAENHKFSQYWASLVAQTVKCLPTMWETQVRSLGWEDPLEKGMATHSSTLAWKIPWTEEPGGPQSMGSLRVGTTERLHFHFSLSCIGEGNGNPLQCSCLENPRDGEPGGLPSMGLHRVGHN